MTSCGFTGGMFRTNSKPGMASQASCNPLLPDFMLS